LDCYFSAFGKDSLAPPENSRLYEAVVAISQGPSTTGSSLGIRSQQTTNSMPRINFTASITLILLISFPSFLRVWVDGLRPCFPDFHR